MTAIADKLQLTLDTKEAIKQALIDKGAEPTDVFSTYPALIEGLSGSGIVTPRIIAPIDGATNVSTRPIITGSKYGGITEDGPDPHQDSLWEFASDEAFTDIVHSSGWTEEFLESYEVPVNESFEEDSMVYARVTYRGKSGESSSSSVISFRISDMDVGSLIGGDIIIGQQNGDWILVAPASKRAVRSWGLHGTDTILPNMTNTVFGDPNTGKYNTDVLTSEKYSDVSGGPNVTGAPAAEYCRSLGGYDLPSYEVLDMVYDKRDIIDNSDESVDGSSEQPTLSNIAGGTAKDGSRSPISAHSSTEFSDTGNWSISFANGDWSTGSKRNGLWVIPVRRIPV